ncbi:MAG: prenyltransferase [Clostridia bacterium]
MEKLECKRIWKGFWQLADPRIWIASTIPVLIGGALAYAVGKSFDIFWFFVSLAALYLIETGKNAVNEVVDYKSGVDRDIDEDKKTPFSGGKKTIVQGKLSVREAGAIAVLTLGAACLIGLAIILFREFNILWIGMAGVVLSVAYSLPPIKLAYRGFGEATVGITFGPLIMTGIYLVMTHSFDWRVLIASLPVGFLIANVLWINQYPDYETDKGGNKRNWVVRLGKKKALKGYALLFMLAFVSVAVAALVYMNPFILLGLAGAPLAMKAVKIARVQYDDIPKLMASNALTIQTYQLTGAGLFLGVLLGGWVFG